MRVGCTAYSYRKYLSTGAMTLEDFIATCSGIGLDGVELTAYYFPSVEASYLNRLKRMVFSNGLDISGAAVGNNFCFPDLSERVKQVESVKKWVDIAYRLGAPYLRVFAGKTPQGYGDEDAFKWTVEALKECVGYAEEDGVVLALENHGGITATTAGVSSIIEAVGSEWLRQTLDVGNYVADTYRSIEETAYLAVNVHAKSYEVTPEGEKRLDYHRIIRILESSGYKGYLSIEYEGAEDPKTAIPRTVALLKSLLK